MRQLHQFDEVFDSQETFRIILEAMANPTRILSVKKAADKLYGDHKAMLAVAMTLLDNETTFCVCGDAALKEQITLLTHAKESPAAEAEFVFVTKDEKLAADIENFMCGTLEDPHKSATVIVEITEEKEKHLVFCGPGIKDCVEINTAKQVDEAVELRDAQAYEYPQGIDFLFLTAAGGLFGIPRLVKKQRG